jgi:hypothetical protein
MDFRDIIDPYDKYFFLSKSSIRRVPTEMSLPVILVITSQRCGHCVRMRGDGRLNSSFDGESQSSLPGGYGYDDTFIRKLISANPAAVPKNDNTYPAKYRVYNLHLSKMGGPDNEVLEIIEFELKTGGTIEERIYKKNNSNTDIEIYTVSSTNKPSTKLHHTSTPWLDTIKNMIPSGYVNYLHFFPMILYFSAGAWDRALREGGPIYGYINGAETSQTPPYGPAPKQTNIQVVDPVILAASFIKGEKALIDAPRATNTAAVSNRVSEQIRIPSSGSTITGDQIRIPTSGNACAQLGYTIIPLPRH